MATKDSVMDALFDYSRSAPTIILEDSDDEDVQIIDKIEVKTRRKLVSKPLQVVPSNIEKPVLQSPVKKADNDDDWLAPPTRASARVIPPADLYVLQLRRQKEELLHLSVRMREEKEAVEAIPYATSSPLVSVDSGHNGLFSRDDPQNTKEKIVLQVQEKSGKSHSIRIYQDDKFERLFMIYADKIAKRPVSDLIFRFDGSTLDPQKTPKHMQLEDEDMIEVDVKSATFEGKK